MTKTDDQKAKDKAIAQAEKAHRSLDRAFSNVTKLIDSFGGCGFMTASDSQEIFMKSHEISELNRYIAGFMQRLSGCERDKSKECIYKRMNGTIGDLKEIFSGEAAEEEDMSKEEAISARVYEFSYIKPFTYDDQPAGYWRVLLGGGGPTESIDLYVKDDGESVKLIYAEFCYSWGFIKKVKIDRFTIPPTAWEVINDLFDHYGNEISQHND